MRAVRRKDLLYPEESYQIIGVLFDVYNTLGPGHPERFYQRAVSTAFKERGIPYREQVFYPLTFRGVTVGRHYLDFLVNEEIILEIKKGNHFSRRHIEQVVSYLKVGGYKLAILANFGQHGITFKRLVNL